MTEQSFALQSSDSPSHVSPLLPAPCLAPCAHAELSDFSCGGDYAGDGTPSFLKREKPAAFSFTKRGKDLYFTWFIQLYIKKTAGEMLEEVSQREALHFRWRSPRVIGCRLIQRPTTRSGCHQLRQELSFRSHCRDQPALRVHCSAQNTVQKTTAQSSPQA